MENSEENQKDSLLIDDLRFFKLPKCSVFTVIVGITIILYTLVMAELFIVFYFAFAGIISLTISLLFYEWLSLLTKDPVNMIISIFVNLSNFGLFFSLTLLSWYIIPDSLDITGKVFDKILHFVKGGDPDSEIYRNNNIFKSNSFVIFLVALFLLLIGTFIFLVFVIKNWLFEFSAAFECVFLAICAFAPLIKIIQNRFFTKFDFSEGELSSSSHSFAIVNDTDMTSSLNQSLMASRKSNSGDANDNENEEENQSLLLSMKDILEQFSNLNGMFDNTYSKIRFKNYQLVYCIIVIVIISLLQLYSLLYPLLTGSISIVNFFIFLLIKLPFMRIICSYNFIDIIFNFHRTLQSMKEKRTRILFYVVFLLHILLIGTFIVVFIYSKFMVFPTISSANYIENNQKWFKLNDEQIIPLEGFCYSQAPLDGSLITQDLAMLTTLPRLYGITKDGKCFIKPSKRGLFNTTMKYIFGKDYEKDNITILCKKLSHYPILVITSDKILNQSLKYFSSTEKFTFLKKQFDIENTNYFENISFENLPKKGEELLNTYKECVNQKGTSNCEEEWDSFTQFYWPTIFNDNYVDISGFERYQINIDSDMIIQPSYITEDGELFAGTHYIVGGSYEDSWGVGMLIETIGKNNVPTVFDNLLPFYSFFNDHFEEVFIRIELFNKYIFYSFDSCAAEMTEIYNLYSQFNFSHQSLFTVGHSISGTSFKGLSYLTDIQGITFEATYGVNNINMIGKRLIHSNNDIKNIYSDDNFISGSDDNCNTNGALPSRYKFPSVYDTACLTTITCGETMKYVSLCKQVLTQNGKNPENEFNISFDAYLDFLLD